MRELPKELTAELLGQVLEEEVSQVMGINEIILRFSYKYLGYAEVNIDTLTRLMIEKIREWNYIFNIFTSTSLQGFGGSIGNGGHSKKLVSDTMFDMALEAFHWVAKEKGLI